MHTPFFYKPVVVISLLGALAGLTLPATADTVSLAAANDRAIETNSISTPAAYSVFATNSTPATNSVFDINPQIQNEPREQVGDQQEAEASPSILTAFPDLPRELYESWQALFSDITSGDYGSAIREIYVEYLPVDVRNDLPDDLPVEVPDDLPDSNASTQERPQPSQPNIEQAAEANKPFVDFIILFSDELLRRGFARDGYKVLIYFEQLTKHSDTRQAQFKYTKASYLLSIGAYEDALKTYQNLLQTIENTDEVLSIIQEQKIYNSVGNLHSAMSNYDLAIRNIQKSIDLATSINDSLLIALSLSNLGVVYRKMGETDKAIESYNRSLQLINTINNPYMLAQNYLNLGNAYKDLGQYDLSYDSFQQSLALSKEYNILFGIIANYINIASLQIVLTEYDKALLNNQTADKYLDDDGNVRLFRSLYDNYAKIYTAIGDTSTATQYNQKYQKIDADIFESEKQRNLEIAQLSFDLQQIEKDYRKVEDSFNEAQVALQSAQTFQRRLVSFSSFLFLLLMGLLSYTYHKQRRIKALYERAQTMLQSMPNPGAENQPRLQPVRQAAHQPQKIAVAGGGEQVQAQAQAIQQKSVPSRDSVTSKDTVTPLDSATSKDTETLSQSPLPHSQPQDVPPSITASHQPEPFSHYPQQEDIPDIYTEIFQDILSAFREEHLFLDPDLSVDDLSQRFNTNRRYISEAINQCSNMNFTNLLNSYRVEYACTLILSSSVRKPMKQIMMDCGFQSNSTFYRAFKMFTGITPQQFRKQARQAKQKM